MELKANIRTDSMGNITVFMRGGLDYEDTPHLQRQLQSLARTNPASKITIDLGQVSFVGSSGIGPFWQTIKSLNERKDQIRLTNVRSEFLKVFQLYSQSGGQRPEELILDFEEGRSKTDAHKGKSKSLNPLGSGP